MDHTDFCVTIKTKNFKNLPVSVDIVKNKECVHKSWWDTGNVIVLFHVSSDILYEDYTMTFGNFNTFKSDVKSDVKFSSGKF